MEILKSKLFIHTIVDVKDDFEEKYESTFRNYEDALKNIIEKDSSELLANTICKEKQHEDLSLAMMYLILTNPSASTKAYSDLTLLSHDGLLFVTNNLAMLVAEKYQRLNDLPRKQLLWFLKELIRNRVSNVDNIVWNILRQASGGDISLKNISLVEGLLDIFIEYRSWIEKDQFLIGTVVYTYLRLLEDHCSSQFTSLYHKEIAFVIALIRDRFDDVMILGRELVRLLQNVSRIPEFELLWKDILYDPRTLSPAFSGVLQLMQIKTSRRFLRCRLTPEVERKLHFLVSSVKFGNQKRYQDWFQEKYFTTPESQSLRSDLIRFIIGAIHPTNDMLCSDIIPRWAVIGWLLTSCTNSVAQANAKLSLFYDWLFFEPVRDNIMNIEPGILVMYHSIKNHPLVSCTLLDFLCRIMNHFYPKAEEKIRNGVYNSLRMILDKQVIPNLFPLMESAKLDKELKLMLRENFKDFFSTPMTSQCMFGTTQSSRSLSTEDEDSTSVSNDHSEEFWNSAPVTAYNTSEMMFSDDEEDSKTAGIKDDLSDDDDLPLSKVLRMEKTIIQSIPVSVLLCLDLFVEMKTVDSFETLVTSLNKANKLNIEQETYVYKKIVATFIETLTCHIVFPESKSDESLSECVRHPIFNLFKILVQAENINNCLLKSLLAFTHSYIPSTGYLLLHYLKVYAKLENRRKEGSPSPFKASVYSQFCAMINSPVKTQLKLDLDSLEKTSLHTFLWILPDLYKEYKDVMINNTDIISLFVGAIDAKNLRDVIFSVTQGKLVMFSNENIIDVIRESLEYETYEQFCFWQLIQAHDVPLGSFQIHCNDLLHLHLSITKLEDIISELDASLHAEALTYILLLLKNEKPSTDLVKCLLSRECKNKADSFVICVLRCWCEEYEGKLSEIIAGLLTSKYPSSSPNKRKRPLKSSPMQNCAPTSDQILHHLEHFRRSCRHGNGTGTGLYVQNEMQRSLQLAFVHSTDIQKEDWSKQKSGKRRKKAFSDSD
ncbi:integrator complex subunit 3 homolog isoform X2 [Malaya genurostris]|uniref:integrator complex subunit 3 homolog isoform X2 n=1 Tax=Malaya genurostris TaxID=325434 RepID=UPI0026F37E3B|nr:integrator complex subunit 3 homolog isoform X2 [Malaya genurostris]